MDQGDHAADHFARGRHADRQSIARDHSSVIPKPSRWCRSTAGLTTAATHQASTTPSSSWLPAVRRMGAGHDQGEADQRPAAAVLQRVHWNWFHFSQYIQDNVEEGLSGVKGANSVKIIGRDLAKLEEIANEVKEK